MTEQRPLTLATLAPVVFSLILGGIIGMEIHKYSSTGNERAGQGTAPSSAGRGAAGGGAGGGGMGGGGASQPNSGRSLARLVGSLATIENLQGKGLTPDQEKKLQPVLQAISSADSLPEADAKTKLEAVQAVLTADQTKAIADMTPARGGRGGGGGGRGGGSGGGMGAPGIAGPRPAGMSSGGGMGGGGGGGQQDPNKPFAAERSKKALDDLISVVKSGAGK